MVHKPLETVCHLLSLIVVGLMTSSCATSATSYLGTTISAGSGVNSVFASSHARWGPFHFIATMTWIDGETVPPMQTKHLHTFRHEDWSLAILAPTSFSSAKEWITDPAVELALSRGLTTTVDILKSAYPGLGGRSIRLIVLPHGSKVDAAWPQIVLGESSLVMTYAMPVPEGSSGHPLDAWAGDVYGMLAHEVSHSFFWFNPALLRNKYSGEVTAYITEACVEVAIRGGAYDYIPQEFDAFRHAVLGMSPAEIYRRHHEHYGDSYLAMFAAANEFKRRGGRAEQAEYCHSMQVSGKDFSVTE